jgi:hypothetical protein
MVWRSRPNGSIDEEEVPVAALSADTQAAIGFYAFATRIGLRPRLPAQLEPVALERPRRECD